MKTSKRLWVEWKLLFYTLKDIICLGFAINGPCPMHSGTDSSLWIGVENKWTAVRRKCTFSAFVLRNMLNCSVQDNWNKAKSTSIWPFNNSCKNGKFSMFSYYLCKIKAHNTTSNTSCVHWHSATSSKCRTLLLAQLIFSVNTQWCCQQPQTSVI